MVGAGAAHARDRALGCGALLKPGRLELPGVDPGNLVRGLGQRCADNRKARRSLGELVKNAMGPADPASRVTALKLADPILRAAF